jgi:hypothetical protein
MRLQAKASKWEDGTFNNDVTQIKVMYRLGMTAKKTTANPPADLKRRTLMNEKPRYLTADEEARLEEAFPKWPEHHGASLFARNTGLRAGAQFFLKRRRLILSRGPSSCLRRRTASIGSIALCRSTT